MFPIQWEGNVEIQRSFAEFSPQASLWSKEGGSNNRYIAQMYTAAASSWSQMNGIHPADLPPLHQVGARSRCLDARVSPQWSYHLGVTPEMPVKICMEARLGSVLNLGSGSDKPHRIMAP